MYDIFIDLADSFECEVHAVNHYANEYMVASNCRALGKAEAYQEIIRALGHGCALKFYDDNGVYRITKATIDKADILAGEEPR